MLEIREIFNKFIHHTPLDLEKKFYMLHYKNADIKVLRYLRNILKGLYIEVLGEDEGAIFELMSSGALEGWCWQTTESAIIFFDEDDYIERGNLKFGYGYPDYYHSWICFKFEEEEYVFDSCLNMLCKKSDYYKTFSVELKGSVSAHDVKTELLRQMNTPHQEKKFASETDYSKILWQKYFGDYYREYRKSREGETVICGPEDVNTPFYRSNVGYRVQIEEGKIKKLVAHYYYSD